MAISLPGICLDEKTTRSPALELDLVLVEGDPGERRAALALAAGGDDHHVAPRQRHRRRRNRSSRESRSDSRRSSATRRMRSSERPATQTWRPVSCGDLAERLQPRGVGGEGGDEHPALGRRRSPRRGPSRTAASEPEASSWKTLVESQTRASTPSSPIARQLGRGRRGRRAAGIRRASSRRCGRSGRRACRSAAHCPRGSNGRAERSGSRTGRAGTSPPISTMLSSTSPVSPSSSSLPAIRPAVKGVA